MQCSLAFHAMRSLVYLTFCPSSMRFFLVVVDADDVPDYFDVVQTPMDYGTIVERLEVGSYVDLIASEDVSRDDELSTMEDILLHVLCDIERVHHNCQLYNKEGSAIFRIGEVHANKWNAYFDQYILGRLTEHVHRDLDRFRRNCILELRSGSHSKRHLSNKKTSKVEKKGKAEKVETTEAPKTPSSASSPFEIGQGRKRKASDDLDEEEDEEPEAEEDHEEEEEDEEDVEEECQKKPKKTKQEEGPAGPSSALIFTEDQMRSLENVFFSSAKKLGEESDDVDACSALTSSPVSLSGNNGDDGGDNAKASEMAPNDSSNVNESGVQNQGHQDSDKPSSGGKVGTSQSIPDVISSGGPVAEHQQPIAAVKSPACSTPAVSTAVKQTPTTAQKTPSSIKMMTKSPSSVSQGTVFQRQWYDRLNELRRYKVKHGTAVVSATSNDKLYHWRSRQRKRYHLTLFRMPHLKRSSHALGEDVNENDKQWLLTMPDMKGVFSLSSLPGESDDTKSAPKPVTIKEQDVESDEKTVEVIYKKHQEQLYSPKPLVHSDIACSETLISLADNTSSCHTTSLFWDECLEELRFFEGEHQHTVVPRDFPHNPHLPIWVEIQRAKYLLQSTGLFSGLTGAQMFVLDELNLSDLSSLPTVDGLLKEQGESTRGGSEVASPPQKGGGAKKNMKNKSKDGASSTPERKSWNTQAGAFQEWFDKLSLEEKPRASEILKGVNWPLYSWCWRQCNASSAVLRGTPVIKGVNMTAKKLCTLTSAGFFRAFPYSCRDNTIVCEDDYEGSEAFDATFQLLEDISIKYGTTVIPNWYEPGDNPISFRLWVMALEAGVSNFVKGEPCVLSVKQVEQLILIGFFKDRKSLPNLTRGDVLWLKMFVELKRHRDLFGVCTVSGDFPHLHQWLEEQKELFRLSRMGKTGIMDPSRIKMLMEAGVDFFTGECLPGTFSSDDLKRFDVLAASPLETFPVQGHAGDSLSAAGWSSQDDNYWNNRDFLSKFERWKAENGHSLILASDDKDLYLWFVEKRGKALLMELNKAGSRGGNEPNGVCSRFLLRHLTSQERSNASMDSKGTDVQVDRSMFQWLHYSDRLMMFKGKMIRCSLRCVLFPRLCLMSVCACCSVDE